VLERVFDFLYVLLLLNQMVKNTLGLVCGVPFDAATEKGFKGERLADVLPPFFFSGVAFDGADNNKKKQL
jgi:hypothetical protein